MDRTHVVTAGGTRAVVDEVGAVLRAFDVDGVAHTETTDPGAPPPMGAGSVLVPWPNRTAGARWRWRGAVQELEVSEPARGHAIHGLLRRVAWTVGERAVDQVTLRAEIDPGAGWPEPLVVTTTYAVTPGTLTVTHTVTATGGEVPVGLGAHPYLRAGAADLDDCVLTVATATVLEVDDALIPTGPARPVSGAEDLRGGRRVADLDLDTGFGADPARGAVLGELRAPDGTTTRLWADPAFGWVQAFTPGAFPAREGERRAVAVEPMTCPPDALNSGVDLRLLGPGETWTVQWGIEALRAPGA